MAEGIPALSIFSACGDQPFGARAAARLGLGPAIEASAADPDVLIDAVGRLLVDGGTKQRARQLWAVLRSGGGVQAAAVLLERLAWERAPVIACAPSRCCCLETAELPPG